MYFFCTGRLSPTFASAYCISKYGVEAFSDALRREMSPWGVLVSVIEPGAFQTAGIRKIADSMEQLWNNLNPEIKKDYQDKRLDGSKSSMYCKATYSFPQGVYAGSTRAPRLRILPKINLFASEETGTESTKGILH